MKPLDIVVFGLSLSSSWGNGHATTYRALLRGLHALGQRVAFLERDVPWYAAHRDLADPDFCELIFYHRLDELRSVHRDRIMRADAIIVGSYVPDGSELIANLLALAKGRLAFYDIDTPVTLASLARGDCAYIKADQIPRLDIYFSFAGGPALDTLRQIYRARAAEALYCAVDETLYRPIAAPPRWDLGYLGTYSADRQTALDHLLLEPARRRPDSRFVVAGSQYPDWVEWPSNVDRIEHLAPADHPGFYGAQRYTLNITRAEMVATGWSPSVRLFEAAACGTPIISDRWPGLTSLLPDGVLIADDPAEIIGFLDTDHGQVASVARKIVLDHHTGSARARTLVGALRQT